MSGGSVVIAMRPPTPPGTTTTNVYLYATPLAASFLITGQLGSATVPGNGDASNALISRHSFPLLSSSATNLVPGQTQTPAPGQNVFLYDRVANTRALVSHKAGAPTQPASGPSYSAVISLGICMSAVVPAASGSLNRSAR